MKTGKVRLNIVKLAAFLLLMLSFVIPSGVPAQAATVRMSVSTKKLYVGYTYKLKLKNAPAEVTWTSSNTAVATVSSKGKVTALKAGKAVITASCKGKNYTCTITVKNSCLSKKSLSLSVGDTYTLTGKGMTLTKLTSDDKSIATVTSEGLVTAKKTGTTTIRVTGSNGKSYTCTVTVKPDSTEGNFKNFSYTDQNGKTIDNSIFADYKLTMVNFWAYWCGPCVGELPDLEELYEKYKDQGFNIIGVYEGGESYYYQDGTSYNPTEEKTAAVIEEKGITYSCIGCAELFDYYLPGCVPFTFFVDSEGNIVKPDYETYGYSYDKTDLETTIYEGAASYSSWERTITGYLK